MHTLDSWEREKQTGPVEAKGRSSALEKEQYEILFQMEERHWWYLGMQRITGSLLSRHVPPGRVARMLDAGCGTGGMTQYLQTFGSAVGVDLSEDAIAFCRRRRLPAVVQGSIERLPFADEAFDLVVSLDVLYHQKVGDDIQALREFNRVLSPGGIAIVRVPACNWLRGAHDIAVHTRHRYRSSELAGKLSEAGFYIRKMTYVNCLLFPIAALKRLMEGNEPSLQPDLALPPRLVNRTLTGILALESALLRFSPLPWGLSVLAVAEKTAKA